MKYNYIHLLILFSLLITFIYYLNYNSNNKEGFRNGFSSKFNQLTSSYKRMFRTNYNLYSKMFSNYLRPFKKIL